MTVGCEMGVFLKHLPCFQENGLGLFVSNFDLLFPPTAVFFRVCFLLHLLMKQSSAVTQETEQSQSNLTDKDCSRREIIQN